MGKKRSRVYVPLSFHLNREWSLMNEKASVYEILIQFETILKSFWFSGRVHTENGENDGAG